MFTVPTSARAVLAVATAAAVLAPTTASARDIVSRVGGPDSAAFAASLVAASTDGRFALLRPSDPGGDPAVPSPTGLVVRDLVAQTTEPLTLTVTGADGIASTPSFAVRGMSDDADRFLISSTDTRIKAAVGLGDTPSYVSAGAVLDRSAGTLLRLPRFAGRPVMDYAIAKLSADGESVIYATQLDPNTSGTSVIVRGPVGGDAVRVLDLPNAYVWDASDDLQTFAYERLVGAPLRTDDPTGENSAGPNTRFIGIKQGELPPRRIVRDKYEQFLPSTGTCTPDRITWRFDYTAPTLNMLSGDGSRVAYRTSYATSADPNNTSLGGQLVLRTRTGDRRVLQDGVGLGITTQGRHHDIVELGGSFSWDEEAAFVKDDQLKLHRPAGQPFVVADDVPLAGIPRTDGPLVFNADEPVDTDIPGDVTYRSCGEEPAPVLPVGAFAKYASLALAKPARAGRTLGVVAFRAAPDGVRTADKVTVEVKPIGLPSWTASRTTTGNITLPKAKLLRPTIIRVTVRPAAAPGQASPAPLTKSSLVLPLF